MPPKKAKKVIIKKAKKAVIKKDAIDKDLEIVNFYELKAVQKHLPKSINPNFSKHHIGLFFNALLVGATGTGKSNSLLNLVKAFRKTFNHMYIFTRASEALYDYLQDVIDPSMLTVVYGYDEFVKFDKSKMYGQSLVIFDDFVSRGINKQQEIIDFYIRGRKLSSTIGGGCCSIYLTQSYYSVPMDVRNNCNYIFILKVPSVKNLKGIITEYGMGINTQTIKNIYDYACGGKFGYFLLLDLKESQNKIYRKNFNEYLNIADFYEADPVTKTRTKKPICDAKEAD